MFIQACLYTRVWADDPSCQTSAIEEIGTFFENVFGSTSAPDAIIVSETSPTGMRQANTKIVTDSIPLMGRNILLPRGALVVNGTWTGAPIKFDAVKMVADAGAPARMIELLKSKFDFEVIVSSGDNSRSRSKPTPSIKPENGDFSGLIHGALPQDPALAELIKDVRNNPGLKYYQDLFETEKFAPYAGMFLAPGRNTPGLSDAKDRPFRNQPVMLLKDFADRETILHEFIHYQIYLDRQQRGQSDPWAPMDLSDGPDFNYELAKNPAAAIEKKINKFKIQIARIGEELDVHKFIAVYGSQLGLTNEQVQSSAKGYRDHLTGSSYTQGMKSLLEDLAIFRKNLDALKNSETDSRIQALTNEIDTLYKENQEKFTNSINGRR